MTVPTNDSETLKPAAVDSPLEERSYAKVTLRLLPFLFGCYVFAIAALTLGAAGVCTTVSQFWNLPPAFLAGVAAAAGIAFVNSVGNISGFVAPYMVGWIKDSTGSTNAAIWVIAGSMTIASMLVFLVPAKLVNK